MTTVLDAVAAAIREEAKNFGALAHKVEGENAIEYRLARSALRAMKGVIPSDEVLERFEADDCHMSLRHCIAQAWDMTLDEIASSKAP